MGHSFERFLGIDWSGAVRASGQQIYVAEAHRHGGRITLHSVIRARDRAAVESFLRGGALEPAPAWSDWPGPTELSGRRARLVGLDFAFGFPVAFRHPDRDDGGWDWADLGRLAASLDLDGVGVRERLAGDPRLAPQFRFERGASAPMHLRLTDEALASSRARDGLRPESVFHLVGPSQVGIGSITGIAMLHRLRSAERVAVWPFADDAALDSAPIVLIEVYPRMWLDSGLRKNEFPERVRQLEAWGHQGIVYRSNAELAAASSGDALDAAAAAIGLARSSPSLPSPAVLPADSRDREGWIAGVQVPDAAQAAERDQPAPDQPTAEPQPAAPARLRVVR